MSDDFADWQYEVANGDTRLGFDEWREHQAEQERRDIELEESIERSEREAECDRLNRLR